jgi:antitoxin component YwqK of YwqJK toxin-antitoxin module
MLAAFAWACHNPPAEGNRVAAPDSTTVPASNGNGPVTIHTADGGRMEGRLENGKRTGLWTSHHPDGTIRSRATYVDGLEEGPTEVFHPNGMTYYTGRYRAGKPVGEWTFYDRMGNEVERAHYDSLGNRLTAPPH